jgi:hypothetical protein
VDYLQGVPRGPVGCMYSAGTVHDGLTEYSWIISTWVGPKFRADLTGTLPENLSGLLQPHLKTRSLHLILRCDLPAVRLDNDFDDSQPQPTARIRGSIATTMEAAE